MVFPELELDMSASAPAFETETVEGVTVLRFKQQRFYDVDKIEELSASLLQFADGFQGNKVVLNLAGVNYFSSAAIGVLIRLSKRLAQKKVKLCLCELQSMVAEIMFLQRLHLVFNIQPDEAAAIASLK